jgi:hypothetical protein
MRVCGEPNSIEGKSLLVNQSDLGSRYPTLATKTSTWQRWGTQSSLERPAPGSLQPQLAEASQAAQKDSGKDGAPKAPNSIEGKSLQMQQIRKTGRMKPGGWIFIPTGPFW